MISIEKALRYRTSVKTVASRTGRSYIDTLKDMKQAREKYHISFPDYDEYRCEECGTEKELEERCNEIKTQNRMIKRLGEEAGWTAEKAKEELAKAKEKYGASAKKFVSGKMYSMDEEGKAEYMEKEKAKEQTRRSYARIVANRSGLSFDEAFNSMKEAKKNYGITFRQYVNFDGEKCRTEEEFEKLKTKIEATTKKKGASLIKNLRRLTGWTKEETEANIAHVKETFGLSARQYFNLGYYMLDDDGIREALAEAKQRKEEVQAKVVEQSGWDLEKVEDHMSYVNLKYGIDAIDYMLIKAWRLSDEQLSGLARASVVKGITKKYNKMRSIGKLTDKLRFDKLFSDCLGRKFWANEEGADFESFCEFWEGMDYAMYKPLNLSKARGVEKIKRPDDLRKAYEDLMNSPQVLLEEVVKQHHEIAEIYSQAVNTVRMVTVLKDDVFHVICSFMRFGMGGTVVDNMFAGGMIAGVDEVNGIVDTGAVDRDGNVHDCHPDTGKQIKGFKIPNYDKVLEITEKALRKDPDINFVGWDVAVTEDGAVIIEGNSRPDPMAYQLAYMQPPKIEPRLYKYEPYL